MQRGKFYYFSRMCLIAFFCSNLHSDNPNPKVPLEEIPYIDFLKAFLDLQKKDAQNAKTYSNAYDKCSNLPTKTGEACRSALNSIEIEGQKIAEIARDYLEKSYYNKTK